MREPRSIFDQQKSTDIFYVSIDQYNNEMTSINVLNYLKPTIYEITIVRFNQLISKKKKQS